MATALLRKFNFEISMALAEIFQLQLQLHLRKFKKAAIVFALTKI